MAAIVRRAEAESRCKTDRERMLMSVLDNPETEEPLHLPMRDIFRRFSGPYAWGSNDCFGVADAIVRNYTGRETLHHVWHKRYSELEGARVAKRIFGSSFVFHNSSLIAAGAAHIGTLPMRKTGDIILARGRMKVEGGRVWDAYSEVRYLLMPIGMEGVPLVWTEQGMRPVVPMVGSEIVGTWRCL